MRIPLAERDVFDAQQDIANEGSSVASDRLASTQQLLQEIKQLHDELQLLAPLWKPDLNDGVIINHAILSAVPRHGRSEG